MYSTGGSGQWGDFYTYKLKLEKCIEIGTCIWTYVHVAMFVCLNVCVHVPICTLHTWLHKYIHTCIHIDTYLSTYKASYICFITIIAVGVMKSQCEKTTPDELGLFCLTPSQALTIFHSGVGQWHFLAGKWLTTLINLLQNIVMNIFSLYKIQLYKVH